MQTRPLSVLLSAALLTSLGGATALPSIAQEAAPEAISAALSETPSAWFIELTSPPAADGTSLKTLRAEKQAFRNNVRDAGIALRERLAFDTLWNGVSINASPAEIARIRNLPGVKAVWPVETVDAPDPIDDAAPDLATAVAMTGANLAQAAGYTGEGIKVAVMDTGIDYDHADLGGDGIARSNSAVFPTARVTHGWDFVGDAFDANPNNPTYNPVPSPDPYPDDCNGHGTHVAGIVGANTSTPDGVRGVAPDVTFGAYRVFGCDGSTSADIMIAAMERALTDGMHVLNMSIGSAFQWPQYPTAAAATRLVNRGMVVVASIGNSGANGLYAAGAPGLGAKVIGVASFDNSHINALTFSVNPGGRQVAYLALATTPDAPTSGTSAPVAFGGRACTSLGDTVTGVSGRVALLVRGSCTFQEKYQAAADAGATAVVIHNNVTGLFAGGGVTSRGIPGVGISQADGLAIRSLLSAGETVTLTWTDTRIDAPNPTGGLISSFSSYGLSPDLALKPDIGGPGGLIRSTYPLEEGGYATISGTSMSSPHVAGGAALLLQAKPRTPSQAVRGILQNSADPRPWWGNPGLGFLDNVHRQGAGMLDIPGAINATTKIEPAKLSLGESAAGAVTRTLTIENDGDATVTYDLGFVNALSTGANTFSVGFFLGNAAVSFAAPSVTVPANGSATVDVTITPTTGPAGGMYGGYIVLTPQGGGAVYRVPYAGFIGDYQSKVVLTPTGNGFPWLARLVGTSYFNQPAGATYSFVGGDIPYFLVHFDHQARRARFEVFDAGTGRAWHRAIDEEYLPRNSTATSFFAFAWDGTTRNGSRINVVPNGQYVVRLSVLKALGDENDPAHWETWTSPVITVARP